MAAVYIQRLVQFFFSFFTHTGPRVGESASCPVRTVNGYWTTCGHANLQTANSQTRHLTDWSTHGLNNSRTSQLVDWISRGLDNSQTPTAVVLVVLIAWLCGRNITNCSLPRSLTALRTYWRRQDLVRGGHKSTSTSNNLIFSVHLEWHKVWQRLLWGCLSKRTCILRQQLP